MQYVYMCNDPFLKLNFILGNTDSIDIVEIATNASQY